MRPTRVLALAAVAIAVVALPATASAHKKQHGPVWKKGWFGAKANLAPATGEDARGTAFLRQRPGVVTVALKIHKLDPDTKYAAQIRKGTDCATPGDPALALPDLFTDEDGVARLWISLPTAADVNLAQDGFLVDVHAYDSAGAVGAGVVCGAVNAPATKAVAWVKPSTQPVMNHGHDPAGPNGRVSVRQDGSDLTVEIHLRGLVPGSTHGQHIHSGTCATMGAIVVPFADAVADSSGRYDAILKVTSTTVVTGGGFLYNLHDAASPNFGGSIACGDLHSVNVHRGPWWPGPIWFGH